jgi:hypothetical protein
LILNLLRLKLGRKADYFYERRGAYVTGLVAQKALINGLIIYGYVVDDQFGHGIF